MSQLSIELAMYDMGELVELPRCFHPRLSLALSWRECVPGEVVETIPDLDGLSMEGILSQDDILSHVFASSCWFDPCWCFPYREPPPNQRPTPAIHLRLLFRLRLICHQWRAVVDEVVAQPHTALDHSGCRRLARWMEHGIPVAYIHTERP